MRGFLFLEQKYEQRNISGLTIVQNPSQLIARDGAGRVGNVS
jgi:hypothetical protein